MASEAGQPSLRWVVTWTRAGFLLLRGRVDDAERMFQQSFDLGQSTGQPDAPFFLELHRFGVRYEQGRLDEIEPSLVEIIRLLPGLSVSALLRSSLALMYCESGRADEARPVFDELAASDFADFPLDVAWFRTVPLCAAVAGHLGDRARAGVLLDLLRPYEDQFPCAGGVYMGSVTYYLGLLTATMGRFDEAEAHFATAEAVHQRIAAPAGLARTRLERARMLLTRRRPGDAERAPHLLGQALATARELGLANVERRVAELL